MSSNIKTEIKTYGFKICFNVGVGILVAILFAYPIIKVFRKQDKE